MTDHVLEPEAQAFADATAKPPRLADLGVDAARKLLEDVQSTPIEMPDIADECTDSYREFWDGPHLTAKAMAWFWDCYLPDLDRRADSTASPLRASRDELTGLPETFLIVDENDVLRDEGEAYGRKLTEAGVRTTVVRYNGTLHDFMMLNPVRPTAASTAAIEQAIHVLRKAFAKHHPNTTEKESTS